MCSRPAEDFFVSARDPAGVSPKVPRFAVSRSVTDQLKARARGVWAAGTYLGRRTLKLTVGGLEQAAEKSVEICPAGRVEHVRPIIREDHLKRIRGGAFGRSAADVLADLSRETIDFQPIRAHLLRDAILVGGAVYCGQSRHGIVKSEKLVRRLLRDSAGSMPRAALATLSAGSRWFGHWMVDEIPLQMLASDFGPLVSHQREPWFHETDYRKILEMPAPPSFAVLHAHEFVVIDEFAQNPDKTRRYRELRRRIAAHSQGNQRVMLLRGNSGSPRRLANESQLADQLQRQGFIIVDPAQSSADQIVAACAQAKLIVGVEGSQMTPSLYFIRDRGAIITLNPPFRVVSSIADRAPFGGAFGAMYVCEPDGDSKTSFVADTQDVLRFIDEVEAHSGKNASHIDQFVDAIERQTSNSIAEL